MADSKAFQILSSISYFSSLAPSDLKAVARAAGQRNYFRDQTIFIEGDPSLGLYVVESGWLKVVKISSQGREQVIHFVGPGEVFNALSVFSEIPNPATVIALEPSSVWLVRQDVMMDLLDSHPKMARSVIQTLAGRVQHLISLVEDLSLRSVETRLARLLVSESLEGAVQRQKWATQNEIAARLGTVPDVLSRALRKLTEEGIIEVSRHQIVILKPKELEKRAELE